MSSRDFYLKEIDSLRALSVIGVVIFHIDRAFLPGGYTGVDCFFVISGFVVTHSMLRLESHGLLELLRQFYARRLLRIAPPLMVVLLATALVSELFIPAAWLSKRNEEIGTAAFFGVSNVFLARPSNAYFGPIAEFNPFTHTWSLAIEEQFYLLSPLILYLTLLRFGLQRSRRLAITVTASLSLLSLVACALWTSALPTFAFYLLPARFWELGAGVLLALTQPQWQPNLAGRRAARATVAVGLVALAASMYFADPGAFPFPWAILSVAAGALLLTGIAARPGGVLPWPLSTGLVQYVGRLSYSLYLWHWPVFVLFVWTVGLDRWATRVAAVAIAVSLAVASYRLVELPVRSAGRARAWRPGWVVACGLLLIGLSAAGGSMIFRNEPLLALSQATKEERSSVVPALAGSMHCENKFEVSDLADGKIHRFTPLKCSQPSSTHRMFVIGDSHSIGYVPMLAQYATDTGHEVQILRRDGCGFVNLAYTGSESAECRPFNEAVMNYLRREAHPGDLIFLASLRLPRFVDQWGGAGAQRRVVGATREASRTQTLVDDAVAQLQAAKGTVIVFEAPKPLFRSPPFRCADWFNASNPVCASGHRLTPNEFTLLRAPILEAMDKVAGRVPAVSIWDPAATLCDANGCDAYRGTHALFFDADHLSILGNATLYPSFAAHIASVWR